MNLNFKNNKKKNWIKFYYYCFFRYHRILFGSLIAKGCKIKTFKFVNTLKEKLKLRFKKDPNLILLLSLSQITPSVILFPIKIGGKIQGVPLPISWRKKWTLATRWVVKQLKDKHRVITIKELNELLVLNLFNKGLACQKKLLYNSISNKNRYLMKFFK